MVIYQENPRNVLKETRPLNECEIKRLQEKYLNEMVFGSVDNLVSKQYKPGCKCDRECNGGCTC
jgi:hypothetical protein